jgi:hypothetical protein
VKNQKKPNKNMIISFAHAHCYYKCVLHHKATVAIDLEFVAKGKRNKKRMKKIKIIDCVRGEFFISNDMPIMNVQYSVL